jgi:hypothetical protein
MSAPPSPPSPSGSPPTGNPSHSPPASPPSASTLNPHGARFRSAGASSSRPSGELPPWLTYSPSSSSSSEAEPRPCLALKDKGKAPLVNNHAPRPHCGRSPPCSAFTVEPPRRPSAAAARSHQAEVAKLQSVIVCGPDDDGWQRVIRKKKCQALAKAEWCQPRRKVRRVLSDLIGLCFNCLAMDHIARDYPNRYCCLRCRRPGHQAQDCRRPHWLLSDLVKS